MTAKVFNNPQDSFAQNINEILHLVKIHKQLAGTSRGRKYDVEVLHKSTIVLLVACWEAFIEDLAERAFGKTGRRPTGTR